MTSTIQLPPKIEGEKKQKLLQLPPDVYEWFEQQKRATGLRDSALATHIFREVMKATEAG